MEETADMFERYVLAYFGLHSDNGHEFKNKYMRNLINAWDGDCKQKSGRARKPNVQGLVEQANGTLESMIAKMQAQTKEEQ